jgi:hypothetical protein
MRAESSQGEMSTDPIDLHIKLVIFHAKKTPVWTDAINLCSIYFWVS